MAIEDVPGGQSIDSNGLFMHSRISDPRGVRLDGPDLIGTFGGEVYWITNGLMAHASISLSREGDITVISRSGTGETGIRSL